MTTKTRIIWIVGATTVAGTGFWLWWRQKDGVPPSAIPIMQQARAVIGITSLASSPATPASTDSLLATIIPGYIAQNTQNT